MLFCSLSLIASLASDIADSDKDYVVYDNLPTSSGNILQLPRESWKIDLSNDMHLFVFKQLSDVDH
jgi:hypothetical protein